MTTGSLAQIIQDTKYSLSQFSPAQIASLEERIFTKEIIGGTTPFIKCLVREKDVKLVHEEALREPYLLRFPVPGQLIEISSQMDDFFEKAEIARRETQDPLDRAKRAVEIAIGQDEAAAMEFLAKAE